MRTRRVIVIGVISMIAVVILASVALARDPSAPPAAPPVPDTGFTYQGFVRDGEQPASGAYDFQFALFNATSGVQVGSTITRDDLPVVNGLVSTPLDFGPWVFDGSELWLETRTRKGDQTGAFEVQSPRLQISPVPYAIYAYDGPFWMLRGNAGTTPGSNFVGTTDDQPLVFKVNNHESMRIVPGGDAGDNVGIGTSDPGQKMTVAGVVESTSGGFKFPDGTVQATASQNSDILNGLSCNIGQIVAWTGTAWVCGDVFPRLNKVDTAGDVGSYSSIAIGDDGFALVSYFDFTNDDLKVAHCENSDCSNTTVNTLDVNSINGNSNSSVAIGSDGLGLIAYGQPFNRELRVAHCDNIKCTSAKISSLYRTNGHVRNISIAVGADGFGIISYQDSFNGLLLAHCKDTLCTDASIAIVVGKVGVGNASIAIGNDGLALVGFYDQNSRELRIAHCQDSQCGSATFSIVGLDISLSGVVSLAIGKDGSVLISYYDSANRTVNIAHCGNPECTNPTITTLDYIRDEFPAHNSLAIGANGLGLVAYYDADSGDLKVAHCMNPVCSDAVVSIVDSVGNTGLHNSIAIGSDGRALIAYQDETNRDLKVARCANQVFCRP